MTDSSAPIDPTKETTATAGEWEKYGEELGYVMPQAPDWKRLPIIRHARAIWLKIQVERHYTKWAGIGIRTGYDDWVINGIWMGKERPL